MALGSLLTREKEVHSFASNDTHIFTGDKYHNIRSFEIRNLLRFGGWGSRFPITRCEEKTF